LHLNDFIAWHTWARHHNNERNVGVPCGQHWRNDSTFAVTYEAYSVGIGLGTRVEVSYPSLSVRREVSRSSRLKVPGRFADTTVVSP